MLFSLIRHSFSHRLFFIFNFYLASISRREIFLWCLPSLIFEDHPGSRERHFNDNTWLDYQGVKKSSEKKRNKLNPLRSRCRIIQRKKFKVALMKDCFVVVVVVVAWVAIGFLSLSRCLKYIFWFGCCTGYRCCPRGRTTAA